MPNWVTNTLTVRGEKESLDKFVAQVGHTHTRKFSRLEKVDDKFTTIVEDAEWTGEFCFWNIHAPDASILDEYHGTARSSEMKTNNWYAWNVDNWGTKWDASVSEVVRDGDNEWRVTFDTAWSPPYPVVVSAAEQHPSLHFFLEWEEEQGFGAEVDFADATPTEVRSWDIPESHADYADRDEEDRCPCSYEEDTTYWYEDCPDRANQGDVDEFIVDLIEMSDV